MIKEAEDLQKEINLFRENMQKTNGVVSSLDEIIVLFNQYLSVLEKLSSSVGPQTEQLLKQSESLRDDAEKHTAEIKNLVNTAQDNMNATVTSFNQEQKRYLSSLQEDIYRIFATVADRQNAIIKETKESLEANLAKIEKLNKESTEEIQKIKKTQESILTVAIVAMFASIIAILI